MRHKPVKVLWVHRVEDCEEVLTCGTLVLGEGIREVLHHLSVVLESREDVLDGQLVVLGHVDESTVLDGQKLLLVVEDLLEEVLIHSHVARQV